MKIFNVSDILTKDEKALVENASVYSSEFARLIQRIEEKYNLIWNIETKQYEKY